MKTAVTKEPNKFEPVTIQVTIESERELALMKSFFGKMVKSEAADIANGSCHAKGYSFIASDLEFTHDIYRKIESL